MIFTMTTINPKNLTDNTHPHLLEDEKAYKNSKTQHETDAHYENELILHQLHATQEQLEHSLYQCAQDRKERLILAQRLASLMQKNPNLWEFSSVEMKILKPVNLTTIIKWVVRDTYIDETFYAEVRLRTECRSDVAELILEKLELSKDGEAHQCIETEVKCSPKRGPYSADENVAVTAIGTTNWRIVNSLTPKLASYLETHNNGAKRNSAMDCSSQGLVVLDKILKGWPNVLRYDSAKLLNIRLTEEYQAIDIILANVGISDRVLPSFKFTLSTCNQQSEPFGQHPRLEFHKDSKEHFENWFAESEDSRGSRLELRFGHPNIMDISVWRRLSSADQLLIGAIISKLPELLTHFQNNRKDSLDWNEWGMMCTMIKSSLQNSLKN